MEEQCDGVIKFSLDYITKTWLGKLKAAEIVLTLLAGAWGSAVVYDVNCNCALKMGFFNFVSWAAFINALSDMIVHLIGLWERLQWIFRHPAELLVLCVLAVVGFLIGSSLAVWCAKDWCVTSKTTPGAVAFLGFVCMALFAVEAFLHFRIYRSMRNEAWQQSSGETKPPDNIGPPNPSGGALFCCIFYRIFEHCTHFRKNAFTVHCCQGTFYRDNLVVRLFKYASCVLFMSIYVFE